ncbi:MAG: hypothetical protein M0031_01960 [Thermaerobacter sp.]|jgi:predicted nucleic acid-binding protein|nr:hypothetical protein [Thermaerobacter sp.]
MTAKSTERKSVTNILLDTGAFVALADQRDDLHSRAVQVYAALPPPCRRLTTRAMVAEVYTFMRHNQGATAAQEKP